MKIKRIVFTPLLEDGKPEVRPPTKGEWFQFPDGATGVEHSGHAHVPYPILARTEEEVEVEVPDPPVVYEWVEKAVDATQRHRDITAEGLSRHAAEVSPERLCDLILNNPYYHGSKVATKAEHVKALWRKK